jgi:hypothetical protein
VGGLTLLANNDDACFLQSYVSFNAVAGTVYRIAVDGYGSAAGSFVLDWTSAAPPPPPADTTPPETTINQGIEEGAISNNTTQTFTFSSSEPGSTFACQLDGGASQDCNSGSTTYAALGDGAHVFSVRATDAAGNSDATPATRTFTIDTAPPAVACASADGEWHASDVSIRCTATDAGSGLADSSNADFWLMTNVPEGSEDSDASTGSRSVSDRAGNVATAGPISGNKVDKKAPTIEIASPAEAAYPLNERVPASYGCSDGGSGVASCSAAVASGSEIDTASVGAKTFTVTATDGVGHHTTRQIAYSVRYGFIGFFDPVRNDQLNEINAGRTIPLKWRLVDVHGAAVTNLSAVRVTVQNASCGGDATPNLIEEEAAGSSGLQNLGGGSYQFNWKTPTDYAGTCKRMNLDLGDGSPRSAEFKLR